MKRSTLDTCKRNELWALIRKVGNHYNEDNEYLKEYAKELVENHDIEKALICFRDLATRLCIVK